MTETRFAIESEFHRPEELIRKLETEVKCSPGELKLTLESNESPLRLGPTVVVALVTGGAKVLSEVVKGLLALLKKPFAEKGRIVIETASGAKIEVPGDTKPEQVREYVELATGEVRRVLVCEYLEVE